MDAVRYLVEQRANIEAKNNVRERGLHSVACPCLLPDWLVRRLDGRRSIVPLRLAVWTLSGTWWRRAPTSIPRTTCVERGCIAFRVVASCLTGLCAGWMDAAPRCSC